MIALTFFYPRIFKGETPAYCLSELDQRITAEKYVDAWCQTENDCDDDAQKISQMHNTFESVPHSSVVIETMPEQLRYQAIMNCEQTGRAQIDCQHGPSENIEAVVTYGEEKIEDCVSAVTSSKCSELPVVSTMSASTVTSDSLGSTIFGTWPHVFLILL